MRISDWSSDVCSSDLATLEQQSFLPAGQASVADLDKQIRANEPGHWLVFTDGRFNAARSDIGDLPSGAQVLALSRSEERRVGNECERTCRSRWQPYNYNKKNYYHYLYVILFSI